MANQSKHKKRRGKEETKPKELRQKALKTSLTHPSTEAQLTSAIAKRATVRKLSALQLRFQKRVDSGNFRMLNESMYTTTGAESRKLMRENPHLFQVYHAGYAEQVKRWPSNPLDDIVEYLSSREVSLKVADLGCGEGALAQRVPQTDVKSFDLVATSDRVVECDIAHVPLQDSSVDVAVFCLSLMGTNYGDYIRESRRILVPGGLLLVAEVVSRFEEQNPKSFVSGIEAVGFRADPTHPLTRAELGRSTVPRKQRRGGGRKRKNKGNVGHVEDAIASAAFFYKFAFQSTKSEVMDTSAKTQKSALPMLGACVYKKR